MVAGPDGRNDGAPAPDDRMGNGRVLVVEEHALVAAGLQLALTGRSWHVETSDGPGAQDVIEHAQDFRPQCVLLDIHLRNGIGSGIELIRPLMSTGSQVVMLTAERRRAVLRSVWKRVPPAGSAAMPDSKRSMQPSATSSQAVRSSGVLHEPSYSSGCEASGRTHYVHRRRSSSSPSAKRWCWLR